MRKTPPPAAAPFAPPKAYSYTRFSTPQQADGDSLRRQTADTEDWCRKNGIPLDTSLSLRDLGVSAFKGRHRDEKAALGTFLEAVKRGKVPKGSFLVIENLDRLSREEERTALRLWLDILDAGVNIVQLHPETVFRHERSDMTDIIRAIIELSRGHSESRMKSVRVAAAWAEKVVQTRANGSLLPCHLPAWVEKQDGRLQLIADRAAVVKRMFELTAQGYGAAVIVRMLVREGVAPFGDYIIGTDGRRKAKKGKLLGSGAWRRVYVSMILRDRRAVGEFQPKGKGRLPDGPPIKGYFPAVVSEEEFYAARAAIAAHKQVQGRIGNKVANLFSGLLYDARPAIDPNTGEVKHGTYTIGCRLDRGHKTRILISSSADLAGGVSGECFSYPTFERAILSQLRELDPADFLGRPDGATDEAVIQGELSWVRERKSALAAELLNGDVSAIATALRQLEMREAELTAKLDDAEEKAVKPLIDSWRDAKSLADLLDAAPDPEDVRLRLRAALRRIIDSVWLLVVHHGKTAIASSQVHFADGGYRSYLIIHRPPHANKHGVRSGRWVVRSIKHPDDGLDMIENHDLRNPDDAEGTRGFLENYPQDMIERLLAEGQPLP